MKPNNALLNLKLNGMRLILRLPRAGDVAGSHYPVLCLSARNSMDDTIDAIESINRSLRKITKNRGSFPNDDALMKLF